MADTMKLASTFKAARVRIEVSQDKWDAMRKKLKEMDLSPCVHDFMASRVFFQVLVPLSCDPLPPHVPRAFTDAVDEFGATILSSKEVDGLICPPATEVCIIGGMEGMCPECRRYRKVIGPAHHLGDPRPVYIMAAHLATAPKFGLCSGTGKDRLEESAT